jgi:thiol-disulfide isomerase/thioredoxin
MDCRPFNYHTFKKFCLLLILLGYNLVWGQDHQPDFSMTMEEFQNRALKSKEEVWVVDFWATWCRPCVMAIPHMKELHSTYAPKGVRFISVSWDQNERQWQEGLIRFQMPWQHLIVTKTEVAWFEKSFPHKGIPTAFVVSRSGKSKRVNDVYTLDKAIDKALAK